MKIVVDLSESRSGLVELLREAWDYVEVRRLSSGDVAVGKRVLFERKTASDFHASIRDGRFFRQMAALARNAARPVVVLEGEPEAFERGKRPGGFRGILLSLTTAFRIPVLWTRDVQDTAILIRHAAAQEARRESERRRREEVFRRCRRDGHSRAPKKIAPETYRLLTALPGVGKARARVLASHIGAMSDLASLGVQAMLRIPGIGPDTAAKIADALQGKGCEKGNPCIQNPSLLDIP